MDILRVKPEYHTRVWGGQKLHATNPGETPIGEAWLVHEDHRVTGGQFDGRRLAEIAQEFGADLLGSRALSRTGTRFPLLIKLLDAADWLSVQVHPNDAQAVQLEGPGPDGRQFGKTEGWHILEADPGAQLIAGAKPGTSATALEHAIRDGSVLNVLRYHDVQVGDTIMMKAGTMHALGPGLLLYEVQQTSDLTYRVFDWNRPASAGRALHLEQSVAVTDASASTEMQHAPQMAADDAKVLITCPYFTLETIAVAHALWSDTGTQSFHAITVTEGRAQLECHDQRILLEKYDTAIVPAIQGAYRLEGRFKALRSSIPED
jgi:mannose-6-phosphate isomerase